MTTKARRNPVAVCAECGHRRNMHTPRCLGVYPEYRPDDARYHCACHAEMPEDVAKASSDAPRVYEIEARVRFHVIGHSAHAALEVLHALDDNTPLDTLPDEAWISFIASCSVDERTITDQTERYDPPVFERHRADCPTCTPIGE